LSLALREKSTTRPVILPVKTDKHSILSFEFKEEIPSIQISKINSLIKETILKIYEKNKFYQYVNIIAEPRFIEYGLIGISIEIELADMSRNALDADTPTKEATFLFYMASAHQLQKSTGLVVNIANAEPYEFKDLFRSDAMSKVSTLIASILSKEGRYYSCKDKEKIDSRLKFDSRVLEKYLGYYADNCFSEARPNTNFYLTPDAIVVKYSRYEIGPGMMGAPEIKIPFEAIKNYVNPNGPLAFITKHI
jgi:hypothetical protein